MLTLASDGRTILLVVAYLLLTAPALPLAWSWWQFWGLHEHGTRNSVATCILSLTTVSFLWIWAGLAFQPLLGADYSDRRYGIITTNLISTVLFAAAAAFRRHRLRAGLVGSCLLVALPWFYVLAVSSVA
jgi:hypothetical protein